MFDCIEHCVIERIEGMKSCLIAPKIGAFLFNSSIVHIGTHI
jgi:hypothetical protein